MQRGRWCLCTCCGTLLILSATGWFLHQGCNRPREDTIQWVRLEPAVLDTTSATFLTILPRHISITSWWVYSGGNAWGVFPASSPIPIACSYGETITLTLRAGIRRNGIANDQIPYPYYQGTQMQVFCEGGIQSFLPQLQYVDTSFLKVLWTENAETLPLKVSLSGTGVLTVSSTFKAGGTRALHISTASSFQLRSDSFSLPSFFTSGFFEFSYRSEDTLRAGLEFYRNSTWQTAWIVRIFPSPDSWKKMYVDLLPYLDAFAGSQSARVIVEGSSSSGQVVNFYLDEMAVLTANR